MKPSITAIYVLSNIVKAPVQACLIMLAMLPFLWIGNAQAWQFTPFVPIIVPPTDPCIRAGASEILSIEAQATNGNSPVTLRSRQDIHYSTASSMDVVLSLPVCTEISDLSLRGNLLLEESEIGIDPPAMYYSIESDVDEGDGTHTVTVRLHYNNNHQGRS